jgi:hypothetical protein
LAETNLGRWDTWYADAAAAWPYGDSASYRLCGEWLAGCATVEDWGCGTGWLSRFIPAGRYRGVDGSWSRFADTVADLTAYRHPAEGICLRHVLEHNADWAAVLGNAAASFTRRLAVVLFTPMAETTRVIVATNGPVDVPDISFRHEDITAMFPPGSVHSFADLESPETFYGRERIYYVERAGG